MAHICICTRKHVCTGHAAALTVPTGQISFYVCIISLCAEKIHVKCNQNGRTHKVKVSSLSNKDGEDVTKSDLVPGAQLILDFEDKPYPVTFIKVSGTDDGHSEGVQSAGECL